MAYSHRSMTKHVDYSLPLTETGANMLFSPKIPYVIALTFETFVTLFHAPSILYIDSGFGEIPVCTYTMDIRLINEQH